MQLVEPAIVVSMPPMIMLPTIIDGDRIIVGGAVVHDVVEILSLDCVQAFPAQGNVLTVMA